MCVPVNLVGVNTFFGGTQIDNFFGSSISTSWGREGIVASVAAVPVAVVVAIVRSVGVGASSATNHDIGFSIVGVQVIVVTTICTRNTWGSKVFCGTWIPQTQFAILQKKLNHNLD
jgi:hypothetical protein